MKYPFFVLLLVFAAGHLNVQAQAMELDLFSFTKQPANYSQYAAIAIDGEVVVKDDSPDGILFLPNDSGKGKITVATPNESCSSTAKTAQLPVGFMLAIKNYTTNSLWLYSPEVLYEVDLEEVKQACELGDTLIFITVDRKFRLPRNELALMNGC